jgi:hypothetical protein
MGSGCASNPCKNGGACVDTPGGGYLCSCPDGLGGPTCETGTIVLSAVNRGWWDSTGTHDQTNNNTLTGFCSCGAQLTNSYFTFLLPAFSGSLRSVTLRLEIESYSSADPGEAYTVFDVLTDPMTLEASGSGQAGRDVYDDLMTGSFYGTFLVTNANVGETMNVTLLDAGVEDVDANRGNYLSVGVHLGTYGSRPNTPEYVRFSAEDEPRVHELVLTLGE